MRGLSLSPKPFYSEVITQIVRWWTKCIVKKGDCVEKLCSCKISALVFLNMKHTVRIIIDSPSYIEMSHVSFPVCLNKSLCCSLWPVYPSGRPVRKSRLPAWVRMLPVPVFRLPWVWQPARLQEISKQLRGQHLRHSLELASHQITSCTKTSECSWSYCLKFY